MIKISYNSTGSVQTIHIKIDDYFAQTPYDLSTKQMDWNSIEYPPTRNSIKNAWDKWAIDKDLIHELRDRPDLVSPQPKPSPDWRGFNTAALSNSAYNRIVAQTSNQRSVDRYEAMTISYSSNPSNPNYAALKIVWDSIIDGLSVLNRITAAEITSLNTNCTNYNMLFSVGSDGKLVLK